MVALELHHDEQAVPTAVETALSEGVLTKARAPKLLRRLVEGKVIGGPPLDTPLALVRRHEAKANVARQDGLPDQLARSRHAS